MERGAGLSEEDGRLFDAKKRLTKRPVACGQARAVPGRDGTAIEDEFGFLYVIRTQLGRAGGLVGRKLSPRRRVPLDRRDSDIGMTTAQLFLDMV